MFLSWGFQKKSMYAKLCISQYGFKTLKTGVYFQGKPIVTNSSGPAPRTLTKYKKKKKMSIICKLQLPIAH